MIVHRGGSVGQGLGRGFEFGRDLGDRKADRLMLRDRHAELNPLLRILDRQVERTPMNPKRLCRNAEARVVEGSHRDPEAAALFTEQQIYGDPTVLEEK